MLAVTDETIAKLRAASHGPVDLREAMQRMTLEIAGRTMDSYHRWMEVVIGPTLAGAPAISVPAGFNEAGLPMGLQIIAAPRRDADLLAVAALYEKLCPWLDRLPALIGGTPP